MELKIPKVLQRIDLGGYDDALSGQFLTVWLNPTLSDLREHDAILEKPKEGEERNVEEENAKTFAWYAKIFSKGEDTASRWTENELMELREKDPAFWVWMLRVYWDARGEHLAKKKKS